MEKKGFVYYYCNNGKGKCEEHKHYLRSDKAEKILSPLFHKIQFDSKFIDLYYRASLEENKQDDNFYETVKTKLENRLKLLAQQELRLLDIQLSGKYATDTIETKLEALNRETADTKQQLKDLETKSPEISVRTLEQTKKVFLDAYLLEKDFIEGEDLKKHQVLEKLLLNATIENQKMASHKLKQPYQLLEKVEDKTDF
jgi:hypothetical protein